MKKQVGITGLVGLGLLGALCAAYPRSAQAAPTLRLQVDQKGDFVVIGNTLGYECGGGTPAPVVGAFPTAAQCGNNLADSAPDVFWRADAPMDGQAQAATAITVAETRSTAVLAVPAGATITHALLYWGARLNAAGSDPDITLERVGGFTTNVTAVQSYAIGANPDFYYQSVADVTAIVQANGPGAYRVSGVDVANVVNANSNTNFAGWWMAVFYSLPTDPPRNLAVFDGLDPVGNAMPQNVMISGFVVPNAGYDAKLGVVTFEGDNTINGDQLFFNGGAALTNPQNPANNFFNGTRSLLGAPVSVAGDLPQLTGTAQSMSGMDIDVVDITAKVMPGQTSAPIQATSTGDVYFLAGFVTSISTFKPDFTTSDKTAVDLNGGALLPGDVIEYTILVTNTGNDASINTVLTDPIPAGVTYVPGSLAITQGANAGAKTDMAGDDQGEYSGGTQTVTVRLGAGANAAQGGTMAVGESATVVFQVTVDAGASGTISNQATINASGQLGSPPEDTPTDGNGPAGGSPPTDVVIDDCADDTQCMAPTPYCNTTADPNVCVQCLVDAHCPGSAPVCDPATNTCICVPTGPEVCDGIDNDCDGSVDPGCADSDGDGLSDIVEGMLGTDPNDADTDDDGVSDGQEPGPGVDTDGDGLINALDPDSDNDGLYDGTELGLGCNGPGTDPAAGHCVPDGDGGATTTDPLDADTDDGGVSDGNEDLDLDGVIDAGETDPTAGHGADDVVPPDSDGDGLSDDLEGTLGSDPNDADSDDDGVIDGQEVNLADDTDGDGLINVLDVDSDNDGLYDGTELGLDCMNPATDTSLGHCVADADGGATTTSPVDPDTDDGGVSDGNEDTNLNGQIDAGETDPNDPTDDVPPTDSDGDGLSDVIEGIIGTDPNDADSDDDGVIDGQEPNFSDDNDGDGVINALDPDSDNDGLFDGTELGFDCSGPGTAPGSANCIPDGDGGATTTNPLDPDTDDGGVPDGTEDTNHNGVIDAGETDPNNGADDMTIPPECVDNTDCPDGQICTSGMCVDVPEECVDDTDCGGPSSGMICDDATSTCIPGCRGTGGNGCPDGQVCSSGDATAGTCSAVVPPDGVVAEGAGCLCATQGADDKGGSSAWLAGIAGLAGLTLRRRRRAAR